jgi:aspartyl-tRNA(Asn)/glutamyl-tRNA(Gln) amidotransferase subunit A
MLQIDLEICLKFPRWFKMDLINAKFHEISSAVKNKKISAAEVTSFFLGRVQKYNEKINAFTHLNAFASEEAKRLDQRIHNGEELGPLAGIPFGIKELFCTKGLKTTASSKILENFVPPYDATAVKKLKDAGAVILGKLNQDEFAMGSSTENSIYGSTKNPWNLSCVAGGSSGGSAAAQSARMCAGTLGTDTGGSIRQPASFCGIVGIKPTYGRISRYGMIAFASSLDQAGPMVSCVEDAALALEVLCGQDPNDSTTSEKAVPQFSKNLNKNVKGKKIAIVQEYLKHSALDTETEKTFVSAIESLKKEGAEIVEVSIPLTEHAVPMYYLIASSEASSNLARYDGVKYGFRADFHDLSAIELEKFYSETRGQGFGKEVKRRIMLGTHCLSSGYFEAYYNKACQVRRLLRDQFKAAFQNCDAIISPVTTSAAFKLGDKVKNPLAMYLNDIFTVSTNLAGLAAISVPFGITKTGLPIGVQLNVWQFEEQKLLDLAYFLQEASSVKGMMPNGI